MIGLYLSSVMHCILDAHFGVGVTFLDRTRRLFTALCLIRVMFGLEVKGYDSTSSNIIRCLELNYATLIGIARKLSAKGETRLAVGKMHFGKWFP